eukprot:6177207-Pleurochrysis_carterae.AAC.1
MASRAYVLSMKPAAEITRDCLAHPRRKRHRCGGSNLARSTRLKHVDGHQLGRSPPQRHSAAASRAPS